MTPTLLGMASNSEDFWAGWVLWKGQGLSRYSAGPSEEQRIEAVKAIKLPVAL